MESKISFEEIDVFKFEMNCFIFLLIDNEKVSSALLQFRL